MDDAELVKAAQRGDNKAFYSLIFNNRDSLYNIAFCYLKNEQDALEAIQEVTCRAYIKLNKLKNVEYFKTWLTRIMINYCIDEQKRKRKIIPFEIDKSSEDNIEYSEILTLEAAVEKLEPKYKKVIVLKYFQDMTLSNIAQVLECPEGTVKTWLSRALKQLRDTLNVGGDYNAR